MRSHTNRNCAVLAVLLGMAACAWTAWGQTTQPVPVAVFFQPARNVPMLAGLGINTFFGPEVENPGALTPANLAAAQAAWIKAVADVGGKVVLKRPPVGPLPAHCVGVLLSVDEPNGKGIAPSSLAAEYNDLKSRYPGVPVFLSLAGDKVTSANFARKDPVTGAFPELDLYKAYAAVADVLTVDVYSMNRNASTYKPTWSADAVRKLALATNKPVWVWVEMNDQRLPPPATPFINREPTPDEIQQTVEESLKAGAKGFGWFATGNGYGWPQSYWPLVNRAGVSMLPQIDKVAELSKKYGGSPPTPPPSPEIAALRAQVGELSANLATTNARQAVTDAKLNAIADAIRPAPATQPTSQPATQPAARAIIPTYHSWNTTDTIVRPEFKPAMWCWYPLYMDLPTKRSDLTTIYGIPPENIRALARACRDGGTIDYQGAKYLFVAGAPVILDFETWYEGHGLDMAAAMTVFRDYVRVFRAEYPAAKIGIYGLTWAPKPDVDSNSFLAGLTPDEEARIVASLKITRILLDECDFIVPSCYLYGPLANVDQDCAVYRANIRLAKKLFQKPVIPFIWASYMNSSPLEPDAAAKLWAMTEAECDGRIIWGNDFPLTQKLFGPLARGK